METSRRVSAAYDQVASAYAERNTTMPASYLELGSRFLALAEAGVRVLDAGCGAGRDLGWLLSQGANAIGGDLSVGMLSQARQHAAGRLLRLDMRYLPFDDGVVGGVWCSASLLHLPKRDAPRALAEMHRILAPRGPLLLAIQEGEGEGWESWPYGTVERLFARYRPDEAEALLAAAGFAVLERRTGEAPNRRWLTFLSTRD
jgi:ubiquinone/menaquinone biosynthesis C-methylase UbiE